MPSSSRLVTVQYLRFFAALLVVLHHCCQVAYHDGHGDIRVDFEIGSWGVDIFFVVSGFIMVFITENREAFALDFFLRRLARVAPLYWLLTLAMAATLLVAPKLFGGSKFDPAAIAASLAFIPWPHPGLRGAAPFMPVGWSLNYEFLFYSVFAAAMWLNWKRRAEIAAAVLVALAALGVLLAPAGGRAHFATCSILVEFVFGMAVGKLYLSDRWDLDRVWSLFLICAALALFATTLRAIPWRLSEVRVSEWGLPALLLFIGVVGLERYLKREIRALRFLGDASYSLYLTQLFSLGLLRAVWTKLHLGQHVSDWILLAVGVSVSLAVASACYLLVEKPLIRGAQTVRLAILGVLPQRRAAGQPSPLTRAP